MVTPHLPWKFHSNRSSRLLIMLTNDVPIKEISIAASRGFSELTQNWNRSSHGHSAPSLKISCKSVQPFSRNLANKETKKETKIHTNKQTNKQIDWKQYPVPRSIGDGVTRVPQRRFCTSHAVLCYRLWNYINHLLTYLHMWIITTLPL